MGQALSRKRSGTATITADKSDSTGVSSNGDVVKTEVNGSVVQGSDTASSGQDAQTEEAPTKKDKKKRRFIFSLKRSRPGSGRKKKSKKEKSPSHNTSTNSGKSNRSSLFMDEFQIPEDDGIDSVSLSSNEDKENKKRKDSGAVIRRSKRGSKSSKNAKKGKKKKQKTEKKKDEKSRKKNSRDEDKTVEATSGTDVSLNVNQSVEPLHVSVDSAKDEAKAEAVSELQLVPETSTHKGIETTEGSYAKSEPEKEAEDDLVAAVTAVMDSKGAKDKSEEVPREDSEDGKITKLPVVEAVVQEEVVQSREATVEEAAITPEYSATSESTLPSAANDSTEKTVSPTLSVDENGMPKRVSLGPRLKTAILKKYSGAGDAAPESQRVTLTKPKIVDVPDLVPPPRKNKARRLLSQSASNASNSDPNASTSSTVSSTEPTSPSNASNSDLDISTTGSIGPSSPQTEDSKLVGETSTEIESVEVSVNVDCSEVEVQIEDGADSTQIPHEKDTDGSVDCKVEEDSETVLPETCMKTESKPDQSSDAVDESLSKEKSDATETLTFQAKPEDATVETISNNVPETTCGSISENNHEAESVSDDITLVITPKEVDSGLTLAQQAKLVVEQVMDKTTASLSQSAAKEKSEEVVSDPTSDPSECIKTSDSNIEAHVSTKETTVLKEESMIHIECSKDKDECILKEIEIIVVATKTYDSEPEENDPAEKPEPVVIIERVHVEPYFGIDSEVDSDSKDSTAENTTVTLTTSSETVIKRQKYSKETGEVCKECLCEEETTHVSRVTNTEQKVNKTDCVVNQTETVVSDIVDSDSTLHEQSSDVSESQKEDPDESSSTTTDSTVVDEEEQDKTLVEDSASVDSRQRETSAEDKPSGSGDEDGDDNKLAQEVVVENSCSVSTEAGEDSVVNEATRGKDDLASESTNSETMDVKVNGDAPSSTDETDISNNNNNCKDVITVVQLTSVQATGNNTESVSLVQKDNPSSTATNT